MTAEPGSPDADSRDSLPPPPTLRAILISRAKHELQRPEPGSPEHAEAERQLLVLMGDAEAAARHLPEDIGQDWSGLRILFYPGGGQDLTPLLLLSEAVNFELDTFPSRKLGAELGNRSLLLWIVDPAPLDKLVEESGCASYPHLWRRRRATCRIGGTRELDLGSDAPPGRHYLVDADIGCGQALERMRFLYSQALAKHMPPYFAAHRISVAFVGFIKAGGRWDGDPLSTGGGPRPQHVMPLLGAAGIVPLGLIGDADYRDGRSWPGYDTEQESVEGWGRRDAVGRSCATLWLRQER